MASGFGRLKEKVAIVTGGGKGIGRAISLAFCNEGAIVVAAGRSLSALEETCQGILQTGGRAIPLQVDVSVEEQVKQLVSHVVAEFGRIDILVNNSGITGPTVPLVDMDLSAAWNETLGSSILLVRCFAVGRCCQAHDPPEEWSYRQRRRRAAGQETASRVSLRSVYCAAKTGLIGVTEHPFARELGPLQHPRPRRGTGPVQGSDITRPWKRGQQRPDRR